ncbi:leucine-rich repeat-containing protein 27-like isoform X2 [Acanthaster planci]|uniref:Leucine-rich repeat-containing protein 27-like isoform X2 n=1 Tax=Acanthaster planci TaxID=133434 RepID=A0A8B7ZSU9_ACAPL|nr:leucine-rich repeat-containing protein 27-like isoform X2 [Acanthaster planci]
MAGDDSEDSSSVTAAATREDVLNVIAVASALGAITLDISRKGLTHIPNEIYLLQHVEYVYLEGNAISHVPSELFDKLCNMKWLDLRNNQVQELPASVGEHRCLKTLLLEGNQLKELPCELGFVKTLTGLNLQRNPLEFPPPKVLERGVKEIQHYLRDAHGIRDPRLIAADIQLEDLHLSDSVRNSSEGDDDYHGNLSSEDAVSRQSRKLKSASHQSIQSVESNEDLEFPRPTSVSLHRHMTYEEYRQLQYEKFKRAGALGVLGRENEKDASLMLSDVHVGITGRQVAGRKIYRRKKKKKGQRMKTPPWIDPLESRMAEEKQLAKLRELQQKQALIEQRRKDQQLLEDWRSETREMQRKHYIRAIKNAQQDFTDPLKTPYDTDPNYMKILSKEERIKQEVKNKHEAIKQRTDPEAAQKLEKARAERDRQLMDRIKQHNLKVQERKQRPRGNPREEMEAAQRDLKMASDLQREVNHRRLELEYRFRAFTGDASPIP